MRQRSLSDLSGSAALCDARAPRAEFNLEPGERIGLIGRNGTGKSSLLGVITGRIALDDGDLQQPTGLRIAYVEQEPELPVAGTLREAAAAPAENA